MYVLGCKMIITLLRFVPTSIILLPFCLPILNFLYHCLSLPTSFLCSSRPSPTTFNVHHTRLQQGTFRCQQQQQQSYNHQSCPTTSRRRSAHQHDRHHFSIRDYIESTSHNHKMSATTLPPCPGPAPTRPLPPIPGQ
jgi:hypothetical protein